MLYLNIQQLFPDIKHNSDPASTVLHFMRDHITKYMAGYMPASVIKASVMLVSMWCKQGDATVRQT